MPGQARELEEQRQLDRAGVLELVDHQQVQLVVQYLGHLGHVQQFEQQVLLVGEVHHPHGQLALAVVRQGCRADAEHALKVGADVGMQLRMGVAGAGQHLDGLGQVHEGLFGLGFGESNPLRPDPVVLPQSPVKLFDGLQVALGVLLPRCLGRLPQLGQGASDLDLQVLRQAGAQGLREMRQQIVRVGLGKAGQLLGCDVVAAGLGHQAGDVLGPVLDAQPVGQGRDLLDLLATHGRLDGFADQLTGLRLVQHLLTGGQARFERKALQQVAAHAIDGADPGLAHGVGQIVAAGTEQVLAHALTQLGGGLLGEGGGDHTRGTHLQGGQQIPQGVHQGVGLAAAGAGADEGQAHWSSPQPARVR